MFSVDSIHSMLSEFQPTSGCTFYRLSICIDELALLPWLSCQTSAIKCYWQSRDDNVSIAGLGQCHQIFDINDPTRYQNAKYFGGICFNKQQELWPNFGSARFILPRLELLCENRKCQLVINLNCRDFSVNHEIADARALLEQLIYSNHSSDFCGKFDNHIKHYPPFERWRQKVDSVKQGFTEQDKIVLHRQSILQSSENIDAWQLLSSWQKLEPHHYYFAFQFDHDQIFIGCTPERLFKRNHQLIETEALAGTCPRGETIEQETLFSRQLLQDSKLLLENTLVKEFLLAQLAEVGADIQLGSKYVIKLKHVQHIKQQIVATLISGVTDLQLLELLHPTPAVNGVPRIKASQEILAIEENTRGWYSGAIGIISKYQSDFAVAIRSALIEGQQATLYAGAGIVQGSCAEQEWQELNDKIACLLSLLIEREH